MSAPPTLDWLLDDFVDRTPAAHKAVVLSVDGLLLGASRQVNQESGEHMAAVAAGFASLSRSAGKHFEAGPVRQTIVEMESAFLLVSTAGDATCLAVLADPESDIGLVAYEMAMLAERIGHSLGTSHRTVPADAR